MDKKPSVLKRVWRAVVKAVRDNCDMNERRNALQAREGLHVPPRRF